MKIDHLDRETLKVVRAKIAEALTGHSMGVSLEEIGIHAEVGHISYTAQNASVKIEISVMGEGGEIVTKEATDYDRYRDMHDLPERGTQFTSMGHTYTITGLKPRSRKFPVMATRADGKGFKFPYNVVRIQAAALEG